MKISLITVLYNGDAFLKDCIESVINQTYIDLEYIVIDGGSTDGSLSILNEYKKHINYFISEKDGGLYDAINKGIKASTGAIIGLLNADDMLASEDIIKQIALAFEQNPALEATYGDLNYIHPVNLNVIRKWKSKQASLQDVKLGWMPAHPTLYLKKSLFEKYGNYTLNLGTAADYDLILRFFYTYKIKAAYLPILMVKMRTGGVSNNSFSSLFNAFVNDYKALKKNRLPNPLLVVLMKKLSKMKQFW